MRELASRGACVALFALLAVAACGPSSNTNQDAGNGDATGDGNTGGPDAPLPHTLVGIMVTPTNPLIEMDVNVTGTQAFVATGEYLDGVPEDLSAQVTWAVANPAVGTMTGATLNIPAFASATAEVSRITATLGTVVGEAQITVVAYRRSGPTQDFFFILPYNDPTGAAMRPLDFATDIPKLDVFFLMDTTGSMYGAISNLQSSLSATIIPQVQAEVADSQFGVGAFEDFPDGTYGALHGSDCGRGGLSTPDQPFHLFQTITASVAAAQTGVSRLSNGTAGPIGCGMDTPESGIEGMYQVATGDGLTGPGLTNVPANHTGVGGVAFRATSMPVIVNITDAMSHAPGENTVCGSESVNYTGAVGAAAHSRIATKAAIENICGRVVGVSVLPSFGTCNGQGDLEDFATATGALVPPAAWDIGTRPAGCAATQCCTGINGAGRAPNAQGLCPMVFQTASNGTGLGAGVVTGIRMLTRFATFDVESARMGGTADVNGNPLPTPHTTADFIRAVTPTGFMLPPPPPNLPNPTFDATAFHGVTPGTQVSFNVQAFNDFVPETNDAQIFRATIQVLAGGCTPLDAREVLILVPPMPVVVQ
ncbi:MAG: hypothetical protein JNK64_25745 [Myxococcales bacterium]|nr:hypothetical protein [Myxococcales bacterium]